MPQNKREILYERAMKVKNDPKGSGYVSFQEFINVVSLRFYILYCLLHVRIYLFFSDGVLINIHW